MKKIVTLLLFFSLLISFGISVFAQNSTKDEAVIKSEDLDLDCSSAILIEGTTGEVLYEKNSSQKRSPASVTKIMTILLVVEAVENGQISLNDKVVISEHASSMGGSQVFLKEGEEMTLEELLKCAIIASANDAALALAEYLAGSEESFVQKMNERARELGMSDTFFENVTGLDDTTANHLTSAADIAKMSRELLKYPIVTKYSSMWQDTIRNGEFTLTNTNRLVRFYDGCNGLKTGSTSKAGYCVSVSAVRNDMKLIAVIMNAPSRDVRNKIARTLLDYGFANYGIYKHEGGELEQVPVHSGKLEYISVRSKPFSKVVSKTDIKKIELSYEIPEYIDAPIKSGEIVGRIIYKLSGEVIGESELYVNENVEKLGFFDAFLKILSCLVGVC
jgi:D-alanyl-D-alanine carboxypeptidase (penicillin-binding protein 5/6)